MVRSKGKYPLYSSQHSKQVSLCFLCGGYFSILPLKRKQTCGQCSLLFWHHSGVFHPAILLEQAPGTAFCSLEPVQLDVHFPGRSQMFPRELMLSFFSLDSGSIWHLASEFLPQYLLRLCVYICVLSHAQLFVTPWTVTHQDPLSMGFPKPEYWSGFISSSKGSSQPRDPARVSCISYIGR